MLSTSENKLLKLSFFLLYLFFIGNNCYAQHIGNFQSRSNSNLTSNTLCPITVSNIQVCPNTDGQLNASGANYYTWSPAAGLSDPTIGNPVVNISTTTDYTLTAYTEVESTNLVQNGDFESGNSLFNTDYIYTADEDGLWDEGNYAVGDNPYFYQSDFSKCVDHTTGTGKMLIVNGNPIAERKIWGQTITVEQNKYYIFYAYITPVHIKNPPIIQFSINNEILDVPFNSPSNTCDWNRFHTVWYSGNNTSADISIVNQNTIEDGNDFAIDDIKFIELCKTEEVVTVTVGQTSSKKNDTICSSELPYEWDGLTFTQADTKINSGMTNIAGCDSTATLTLFVNDPSTSTTEVEVELEELPYKWNNTEYKISGKYNSDTKFTNSLGCDSIPILILKVNAPTSSITNDSICEGETYWFNGTSYNLTGIYSYITTNTMESDSTAILNLTVNSTFITNQSIKLLTGEIYSINGNKYSTDGTYTDILKTTQGCDSTVVTELSYISIPNTLTPNGDGENDIFMKGYQIKIYNRNGILLYDGSDGWDGTYNNKTVSKDTYFYVLYYMSDSGIKNKEGYLMVLR